jgi:response regulator RpfG family c-di-GMP phosphodiesterase
MNRIIMLQEFRTALFRDKTFLSRAGIALRTAASNEDVLSLHRDEPAGVIVTRVDAGTMSGEQLCAAIREDRQLRNVSVIMVCPNTDAGRAAAARCRANEVLTLPLDTALLMAKAQQLMQVTVRKSYRVLLSVTVEGKDRTASFLCKSENVSATGLLIETARHLQVGDRLSCSFFLGPMQVSALGEIVRVITPLRDSSLNRYGIRFTEISESAKAAIEAFAGTPRPIPGS